MQHVEIFQTGPLIAKSICQNTGLYRPFSLLKALWEDVSMNFVVS